MHTFSNCTDANFWIENEGYRVERTPLHTDARFAALFELAPEWCHGYGLCDEIFWGSVSTEHIDLE